MSEFIEIHSKRIFWIYVKIRYENLHCTVIVDNMKEDCVLLEKTTEASKGRPCVVLGFKVLSSFTLVSGWGGGVLRGEGLRHGAMQLTQLPVHEHR